MMNLHPTSMLCLPSIIKTRLLMKENRTEVCRINEEIELYHLVCTWIYQAIPDQHFSHVYGCLLQIIYSGLFVSNVHEMLENHREMLILHKPRAEVACFPKMMARPSATTLPRASLGNNAIMKQVIRSL